MLQPSTFKTDIDRYVRSGVLANERNLRKLLDSNLRALKRKLFIFQCTFFLKRGRRNRFVFIGLSTNLTSAWYDRKTKTAVFVPFYSSRLDALYKRESQNVVSRYNWQGLSLSDLSDLTFS